jgi:hypothetical protein
VSDIRREDISILGTAATRGRSRLACLVCAAGVGLLAASLLVLCAELPSASHEAQAAVGRGIVDYRLETLAKVDLAQVHALAGEMGLDRLRARWTRIMVRWVKLQPVAPGVASTDDENQDGYADSYVRELDTIIGALAANRVNVILTFFDVPEWASNQTL